jgi:hypothetical protein
VASRKCRDPSIPTDNKNEQIAAAANPSRRLFFLSWEENRSEFSLRSSFFEGSPSIQVIIKTFSYFIIA